MKQVDSHQQLLLGNAMSSEERTSRRDVLLDYMRNNIHFNKNIQPFVSQEDFERYRQCRTNFTAVKCNDSKCRRVSYFPNTCKRPFCEYCYLKKIYKKKEHYLKILSKCRVARSIYDRGLRFLTLTMEKQPDLAEAYRKMNYFVWKLERSKYFKDRRDMPKERSFVSY